MDKVLSIIVPSYNMEKYLEKCLSSLILPPEQMPRLEVIVVNDGSKDRTSEIAHRFADLHTGSFVVIDKENGHYGSCVNAGLKIATGHYVRLLDADDFFDNVAFVEFFSALCDEVDRGGNTDLFLTDYICVDARGLVLENKPSLPLAATVDLTAADLLSSGIKALMMPRVTYRRENLIRMQYKQTEKIPYTDTEWVVEPLRTVEKARYLKLPMYCYFVERDGQSMSYSAFAKSYQTVANITAGLCANFARAATGQSAESWGFYRRNVVDKIGVVYINGLLGYCGYRVTVDLKAFDAVVVANDVLKRETDDLVYVSRWMPVRYVRSWRRWRTRNTPALTLLRFYLLLARMLVRMLRK